jgi:hypothetical protein
MSKMTEQIVIFQADFSTCSLPAFSTSPAFSASPAFQRCGSGTGIRCLFDPWIRDR